MSTEIITGVEGNKYNRLTAIRYIEKNKYHKSVWEFLCDCGKTTYKVLAEVRYGHILSCGCSKGGRVPVNKLPEGEASFRCLYKHQVRQSEDRGYEWKISEDYFRIITKKPCHYCGKEPSQIVFGAYRDGECTVNGSYIYNGLDRVDNKIGYLSSNVVSCCKICNIAKAQMTVNEFLDWIERVYNHSIRDSND